ncbi:hypothetical protein DHX103_04660 [Planococcus sp. X10-3]|uniref:hypothetical protein n=1 Tax=Planococcus sp. X10-3 TaxID=3061240 RepID=UPI003BAFAB5D
MATKLKNEFWSVVAVTLACFTLLYCLSFIAEMVFSRPATDLLASLRMMSKGDI